MKTVSIYVSNLCVPCENRCRYCLLSWDGKLRGVDYERSRAYAERFCNWLKAKRPDMNFAFYYGYSMEHPQLLDTIDFARKIGSPGGSFLQFDGMKFRADEEVRELLTSIQTHGIELIDLTFYGTREYHDRFAARKGDFDYMIRILKIANQVGLPVNVGIALNHENADQGEPLLEELKKHKLNHIFCFVPHAEGRGETLNPVRFRQSDYDALPQSVKEHFNSRKFRTEGQWVREGVFSQPERRALGISLTPQNVDFFENMDFADTISYLERLDDTYYAAIPTLSELANLYGDPAGECFYSERDLFLNYQRRYIAEHGLKLHDVNDERQCFSRRF